MIKIKYIIIYYLKIFVQYFPLVGIILTPVLPTPVRNGGEFYAFDAHRSVSYRQRLRSPISGRRSYGPK